MSWITIWEILHTIPFIIMGEYIIQHQGIIQIPKETVEYTNLNWIGANLVWENHH